MPHRRTLRWLSPLLALVVALPLAWWVTRDDDPCDDRTPDQPGPGLVAYTGGGGVRGAPGEFLPAITYTSVFLLEVATGCITQPSREPFQQSNPDLSPDGRRIVFEGSGTDDTTAWGIYMVDVDGDNLTVLLESGVVAAPRWSPDGQQIVFVRHDGSDSEIAVMHADGSNLRVLTDNNLDDSSPDWSPDGRRIVFSSGVVRGQPTDETDLFVMHAGGTGLTQLTHLRRNAVDPVWSPDGARIAFASTDTGDWDIYVVNADGASLINLTGDPLYDRTPTWSPDGSRIAFFHYDGSWHGAHVMRADGAERQAWEGLPLSAGVHSWWAA